MTAPILEATDVVKFLGHGAGQVQALKGVSLTLAGGELALLMGPSGSGKTTLLSILGCMLTPTSGTVLIGGQSTAGAAPEELAKLRREHVGFVFQSYHLFPTLSALDNVRLALDVRGENAGDVARQGQGGDGGGRPRATSVNPIPRELSGGEQQRVAIARALVGNPSAVLADEPTAALDSDNGQTVMTVLAEIAKSSARGVLVVAHDPRIIPFANRIIHIEDGRIVGAEPAVPRRRNSEACVCRVASNKGEIARWAAVLGAVASRVATAVALRAPARAPPSRRTSAAGRRSRPAGSSRGRERSRSPPRSSAGSAKCSSASTTRSSPASR